MADPKNIEQTRRYVGALVESLLEQGHTPDNASAVLIEFANQLRPSTAGMAQAAGEGQQAVAWGAREFVARKGWVVARWVFIANSEQEVRDWINLQHQSRDDVTYAGPFGLASPAVAPSAQPVRMLTRAEVDEIVYQCRQAGDDTTYAIVHAALVAAIGAAPSAQEPQAAHSKSEYKRRVALGDPNVLPPAEPQAAEQSEHSDSEIEGIAGNFGSRWRSPDEEGWNFDKHALLDFARALLAATKQPAQEPATGATPLAAVYALRLARPYVLSASVRMYDGTGGHAMREEAKRRLALIDAALVERAPSAPAAPVVAADAILTDAYAEGRLDEQQELASVLPGTTYMDPPDGGAPSILEQLQRQAKDAARYLWLRNRGEYFTYADDKTPSAWVVIGLGRDDAHPCSGAALDNAVDAAMQSTEAREEEK